MTGNHEPLTANRQPLTMRTMDPSDEQELGFYRRYRYLIWIGAVIILAAPITLAIKTLTATKETPAKVAPITFVKLLPPAPTPTPPPPQPQSTPLPQEQMLEQKRMMEPETKPEHPDEKPKADSKKAPGPLGVNAKGEGKGDAFGLVGRSGGNGLLDGGGGGGSRFGWYASQIQARIEEALRQNNRTRSASIAGLRVRIWADNTGRVTRAQLVGSSGDPAIDNAIQNEVLTGLQLKQAPPADMPMPIVLRVTAHRSS